MVNPMPKKIIVHTCFVVNDGIGDLLYLMHWLRAFEKFHPDSNNVLQHVMINAENPAKVEEFIKSYYELDPVHPIFNFFVVSDEGLNNKTINGNLVGALSRSSCLKNICATVGITNVFPHVQSNDFVAMFNISAPTYIFYKDARLSVPLDLSINIYELGSVDDPIKEPKVLLQSLGLGDNDLGLLHDLNGITGKEALSVCIANLSPNLKKIIFNNDKISPELALKHLHTNPMVLSYLTSSANIEILNSVFKSAIIQESISNNQTPLFIVTGYNDSLCLSSDMQNSLRLGQIRVLSTWLSARDYAAMTAIALNRDVNSWIVPSGDNGLIQCIKAGKLPLYAHKKTNTLWQFIYIQNIPKHKTFASLHKILSSNESQTWRSKPGFNDCMEIFSHLKEEHPASGIENHITTNASLFFRDTLGPYLMDHYAFEDALKQKILPMFQTSNDSKPKYKQH